ncbi:MAG TPA: NAD(P)-binding protein [Thermoanaerobaculia bacterium]|jgi:Trk K+ transport system NAD-binding subunit
MAGHCIVCGMGAVGYRIVELLHRLGERVVVITEQVLDERRQTAEALGVRVILGDARGDRLLREAGLDSARALIAATDQDLVNLEVALDARRLRPDLPVVIRLFDQELARQLETSLEIRRALGMSALAAPSFTAAALGEAMLASLTLREAPYVVGRQIVGDGPLAGCPTVAAVARRFQLLSVARERPGEECAALPAAEEPLAPGDRLSLLGRKRDWDALFTPPEAPPPARVTPPLWQRLSRSLRRGAAVWKDVPLTLRALFLGLCLAIPAMVLLFHYWFRLTLTDAVFFTVITLHGEIGLTDAGPQIKMYEILLMVLGSVTLATLYSMITDYLVGSRLRKLLGARTVPRSGHIVVVGMGHIGFRVVDELAALGVPAVAVDADPDGSFLAAVRTKVPLVVGDARLDDTLERAGLARARAVVAATGDDSVNLGIGIAARRMNPRVRTVVRLFDAEFARKVENALGIDAALSSSRIAAPTFVAAALFSDVAKAFIVGDRLFILTLRKAGPEWAGRELAALRAEEGIHILVRNGQLVAGRAEAPLSPDEEILAGQWRKLAPARSERTAAGV